MDFSKETQEKISQLQLFEQNLHTLVTQKRTFQSQVLEIENALKELQNSHEQAYKIVGSVMFKATQDTLKADLEERKSVLDLRLTSLEKQEKNLKEKAEKIQADVMAEIEKGMKD